MAHEHAKERKLMWSAAQNDLRQVDGKVHNSMERGVGRSVPDPRLGNDVEADERITLLRIICTPTARLTNNS